MLLKLVFLLTQRVHIKKESVQCAARKYLIPKITFNRLFEETRRRLIILKYILSFHFVFLIVSIFFHFWKFKFNLAVNSIFYEKKKKKGGDVKWDRAFVDSGLKKLTMKEKGKRKRRSFVTRKKWIVFKSINNRLYI